MIHNMRNTHTIHRRVKQDQCDHYRILKYRHLVPIHRCLVPIHSHPPGRYHLPPRVTPPPRQETPPPRQKTPSPPRGLGSGNTIRRIPWTDSDDLLLCSSWLNISLDPVHARAQKARTFWDRILDLYNSKRAEGQEVRTKPAIANRWLQINRTTLKFAGYYKGVVQRRESGLSEVDIIIKTKKLYHKMEGEDFKFIDCWRILDKEEKWKTQPSYINNQADPIEIHDGRQSDKRPLGKKASKSKGKEKIVAGPSMESLISTRDEQMKIEKDKVEAINTYNKNMERKLKLQEDAQIQALLAVDEASLTEDARKLHRMQLQKYLDGFASS